MKIQTKYNFGDRVWKINTQPKQTWETCSFCNGIGSIVGQDASSRICPECYGENGKYIFTNEGYRVTDQLTIGKVKVSITAKDSVGMLEHEGFWNYGTQKAKYEETYMCKETGIGSGSLHDVSTLWFTAEEAEAECKRRNEEDEK